MDITILYNFTIQLLWNRLHVLPTQDHLANRFFVLGWGYNLILVGFKHHQISVTYRDIYSIVTKEIILEDVEHYYNYITHLVNTYQPYRLY